MNAEEFAKRLVHPDDSNIVGQRLQDDPAGQLLYLNHAGRTLLGVGIHEDISKSIITEFLPNPNSHPVLLEGIPTSICEGIWHGEIVLFSRKGVEIPFSQIILSHKSANGKLEVLSILI